MKKNYETCALLENLTGQTDCENTVKTRETETQKYVYREYMFSSWLCSRVRMISCRLMWNAQVIDSKYEYALRHHQETKKSNSLTSWVHDVESFRFFTKSDSTHSSLVTIIMCVLCFYYFKKNPNIYICQISRLLGKTTNIFAFNSAIYEQFWSSHLKKNKI